MRFARPMFFADEPSLARMALAAASQPAQAVMARTRGGSERPLREESVSCGRPPHPIGSSDAPGIGSKIETEAMGRQPQ